MSAVAEALERERARPLAGLVLLTLGGYLVGYGVGWRWLLPVLVTAPAYAAMVLLLRRGRRAKAIGLMLVWAVALGVAGTAAVALAPERAELVVWNGPAYRDEMIHWVATGEGAEGRPREFLPRHLRELAIYVPVSLLTGGAAAMLMGAVLMNYMDFFVASLALASTRPWLVALAAWFPWAVLRVGGYVILGVVTAEPLVLRWPPRRPSPPGRARWVAAGVGLLVGDVAVKALLAPSWGRWLATYLVEAGR